MATAAVGHTEIKIHKTAFHIQLLPSSGRSMEPIVYIGAVRTPKQKCLNILRWNIPMQQVSTVNIEWMSRTTSAKYYSEGSTTCIPF